MLKNKSYWTILLVLVSVSSFGQLGTSSPYSFAGLGELKQNGFTQHAATGGASIAQQSENSFTPNNPASLASVKYTVFDIGAYMSMGRLSTESESANTRTGNLSHFAMAFPFETKRKMAMSFGLNQYSDVGYEIENRFNNDTPSYYNILRGNGGIHRLFLGYGVQPIKGLNIGASVNYNFGSIQSAYAKIYPNTDARFSFSDETFFAYEGFDLDLGAQYTVYDSIRLARKKNVTLKHTLAGAFNTRSNLNGEGYRYSETFYGGDFDAGDPSTIDTIYYADNLKNVNQKPLSFSLGYTVSHGNKWSLSAEMERSMWSTIAPRPASSNPISYRNNERYSLGFSIVPRPKYEEKGDFFWKVRYSAGLRYENLYYVFNNTPSTELGISFGLGLPIVKSVRIVEEKVAIVSTINIILEYIKRGSTGLIQEDYFKIGLGLNLNDKWFTKRKYY